MPIGKLLSSLGLAIKKDRPLVPATCGYRIVVADPGRRFAQIWLRTRGCQHDVLRGGCTFCNYWASTTPSAAELVASMDAALDALQFVPDTVVLSASGSFLDPWEIDPSTRTQILKLLRRRCPDSSIIIETHYGTISKAVIDECSDVLGSQWTLELGLESVTQNILKCCINKPINLSVFSKAIDTIKTRNRIDIIVNIALGAPFLNRNEIIDDAVLTIEWAFFHGIDECVLFPMNTKPFTLIHWLSEHHLYRQPSLWVLVDVLSSIHPDRLPQVNFAWHRVDRGQGSIWDNGITPPTTCDSCYPRVISKLDEYLACKDRESLLGQLQDEHCPCRITWLEATPDARPLAERLLCGYQQAANDILGLDYWKLHGDQIQKELLRLFNAHPTR